MRVLITGATGFVGHALCHTLRDAGMAVTAAVRAEIFPAPGIEWRTVGEIGPETDWTAALAGADAVVHTAGRAHVMKEQKGADPEALFRRINTEGTLALARQAARAGVKRFVFVSSIKVNGETADPAHPFCAGDPPAPADPYGRSKAAAEIGLADLGLDLTVIRPPLVHGPAVKGNLAALMRLIRLGIPLPLGGIDNRRSVIGRTNLNNALHFLLTHPATIGGTFLIKDGEDVSTPDLIRRLARAMNRPARLLPIPQGLLRRLPGGAIKRLTGSLVVDDGPLRALGWRPPLTLDQGLATMAQANREQRR